MNNENVIRLDEETLHQIIIESVYDYLMENEEDEGLWNQISQGAKSFFGNGYGKGKETNYRNTVADRQQRGEHTANWMNGSTPMNLKQRWKAAKTGYKEQGRIDGNDKVANAIQTLLSFKNAKGQPMFNTNMTLAQVQQKLSTDTSGAKGRVSKANNNIYRGTTTGVMGSGNYQTV